MADENIAATPVWQENENAASENPRLTNKEAKSKLREKYNRETRKLHRGFVKENHKNYKDPEEVDSQIIDLSQLLDPPDNFKIQNLDTRHPEMADGFALLVHHFWNINPQVYPKNVGDRIKLFRKLAYNQDEQHRPRDLRELSDLTRDAGPRLLKPEILRRLGKLPISRHYPEFTEGTDWEEQRIRPTHLPKNQASGGNDGCEDGDGPGALALEETPPNLDLIRECLERLLIQLRYRELEVVNPTREEELFHALIDSSEGSRRKRLPIRKVPLTLDNNHKVEPNFGGFTQPQYPSREKGPVGNDFEPANNSRFDCIMIAGKFLDAGFTKVDTENLHSHGAQQTNSHRNFLNMVQTDWKQGDSDKSQLARLYFHRRFNDLEAKDFRDLMYKSTLLRPQFSHTISRQIQCENDHEMTAPPDTVTTSLVCFDEPYTKDDATRATMQEVLQSLFPQQELPPVYKDQTHDHPCTVKICEGKPNKTIVHRSMPLRIAVSLSSQVSPVGHTSNDIRIKFYNDDKGGAEDIAVYRWVGGIYADTQIENSITHYRVYWTDSLRGGQPSETISIYDPLQADGQVIEGVFPASQNEPIPAGWWQDKFKPVLFYERVFNPDMLDITLAAAILGDMKHVSDNSQYILQVHDPQWKFSPLSNDQPRDQGDSNSPRPNPPPTTGGPSGTSPYENITGYAGAAFDTALNDLDSGDVHMQDGVDYNEISQPSHTFSQNNGNTGDAEAGYNSNLIRGLMPPSTRPASDNHGMFRAFNSDMSQVAPDRPRSLLTEHYSQPAATKISTSNFAPRDLDNRLQFIPVQPSTVQGLSSTAQNTQVTAQFESVVPGKGDIRLSQPLNSVNQTITAHTGSGLPSPTFTLSDFIQITPHLANLNAPLRNPLETYGEQDFTGDKLENVYDDLFGSTIPMNSSQVPRDILDTLPSCPGGTSSGGYQSQQGIKRYCDGEFA
ncbi:hypothetical protein EYB26_002445 [Talaromyces marneffei]|uniref:uncharacterized protein n=1 Tax=Talaromyces marneffei TaxID=37727 RepID=UPI0012A95167|nr:uncharacterized protein EYB26_002445 [Talaromyces marneffei]QGA14789.1 hypothetical protein EYB26_002445 [Talaromyces marneffei]